MNAAATLPDGRAIAIDASIAGRLLCGALVLDSIRVGEAPEVWTETAGLAAGLVHTYEGTAPGRIPGLAEARTLYKSFGVDPSRHRPSSEALLRRVLKGKELYRINNAVDSCNLASLSFLLPVGMYDLDKVDGDVVLRAGRQGEEYPGIRKGMVHLDGRLGLFDASGPFGSPTSDSARTRVTEATTRILAVIMATAGYPGEQMAVNLDTFTALFVRHCGGAEVFRAVLAAAGGKAP